MQLPHLDGYHIIQSLIVLRTKTNGRELSDHQTMDPEGPTTSTANVKVIAQLHSSHL